MLLPISAGLLVASITIPILKNLISTVEKEGDDGYEEDDNDDYVGSETNPISKGLQSVWKKIAIALRLNKDSNLSSGEQFSVKEYSMSESV